MKQMSGERRNNNDWTETLVREDSIEYDADNAFTADLNLFLSNASPE